jgi:periplasmic nitrate reductase NapE
LKLYNYKGFSARHQQCVEAAKEFFPMPGQPENTSSASGPRTRREELLAFLILAVVIWPGVAVGVVGGYGFLVWMWQLIFGPPGPPG